MLALPVIRALNMIARSPHRKSVSSVLNRRDALFLTSVQTSIAFIKARIMSNTPSAFPRFNISALFKIGRNRGNEMTDAIRCLPLLSIYSA